MEDELDFNQGGSGASTTYPMQCSALRKNGHVMIKDRPCKIVEMSTSKTGKHGHAKVHLVGIDIFTSKRYEDLCPSTHNIDVPVVSRLDYTLIDISNDGFVSLMDKDGNTRDDLRMPIDADLSDKIKADFEEGEKTITITVMGAVGEEMIVASKIAT